MNFNDFDLWWRERGDFDELQKMRAHLEGVLQTLTPHAPRCNIEYSIQWRLARWHHFAAMLAQENRENKARDHFASGAKAAQRALQSHRKIARPVLEANFWWSVNALENARLTNKIVMLRVLPRATQWLQKIARDEEEFHFAGAQRVLGRMTHLKPRFLGGDAQKSLSWFHDALDVVRNSTTLLYYAEALLDANEVALSQKILREIVSQPLDFDWKWEQARDKSIAARLLKLNVPEAQDGSFVENSSSSSSGSHTNFV